MLAQCLLLDKRLHAAELEARIALSADPEMPLALYALGHISIARRRFAQAREHFEQLIALEPDDPTNHRALAQLEQLEGDPAAALAHLERARAADPEDATVLSDLADLACAQGDLRLARRHAEAALELAPGDADSLISMGKVLLREGSLEEAHQLVVSVLQVNPRHGGAIGLLAQIKARQSPLLGIWWRWNTWMHSLGDGRSIGVLLAGFFVYAVLSLATSDLGLQKTSELVDILWLLLVAYTWVGPVLFMRMIKKELGEVELSRDF